MAKNRTKKALLVGILAVLLLPFAQDNIKFIHSGPLYGVFEPAKEPVFSFSQWWSGRYQDSENKFINDNIGFRADMIRVNNQLDYSLFEKLHFSFGVMGTNGCVWDQKYIDAYLGRDFMGYDSILVKLQKLKKIQDTLAALGKTLVFVQAPCKGFFYPECFPAKEKEVRKGATNLEVFDLISDSLGINQVNFNNWFMVLKIKTNEVIYPKQGIHWSLYGSVLAADSFVKYMSVHKAAQMPRIKWSSILHERTARETDNDLGRPLNLVVPISNEVFSYPVLSYGEEQRQRKPKAIYIGDSFLFQWYYSGVYDYINTEWQLWYYFSNISTEKKFYGVQDAPQVKDMDWVGELLKVDYVVLLYTAKNLPALGTGFIEQAYDHFYPKG